MAITYLMKTAGSKPGMVSLVGAGPGDPELLTVKAMSRIQNSDMVLIDNLVSSEIRALIPSRTTVVEVGKRMGSHTMAQSDISDYLVQMARLGKRVCRLKGGDPFLFGRGSEELSVLMANGIPCEVIPGITAAAGCSSYAGIPLTHRGMATGCTFVTGHRREGGEQPDWAVLARLNHTLVFYMGLNRAAEIASQLTRHGLSGNTPVALIENGCRPEQRTVTGSLAELGSLAEQHKVSSPALIVIGEVVSLSAQLEWWTQAGSSLNSTERLRLIGA